jgi:putative flippase GtrA
MTAHLVFTVRAHHPAMAATRAHAVRRHRRPRLHIPEFLRFAVVGASGYVVNLVVFGAASHAGAGHRAAATLAFLIAVVNNFAWNRQWTFRTAGGGAPAGTAVRFALVSVTGFGVSLALLDVAVAAGLRPLLGQALAITLVTPLSYLGNRWWTFAMRGAAPCAS